MHQQRKALRPMATGPIFLECTATVPAVCEYASP